MGLNPLWQEDVFLTVQDFDHQAQILPTAPYAIIACNTHFFIHLIAVGHHFVPAELIALQEEYQERGQHLVHLWEDVWLSKRDQVLSRFMSFLGLNKSFHGRKAKIETLDQKQTLNFFDTYHLQGYVRAKYSYGLVTDGALIAVASFSDARPMKSKGADYQSAELVRFASKDGLTIVGGLSKLIKHFSKQLKINDLMTYADRDWSLGKGYDKLGFTFSAATSPGILYVNATTLVRYFPHRLPKTILSAFEAQNVLNLDDFLTSNGYFKLFNTGNLKYHLYF